MVKVQSILGRVAYAVLFVIGLPVGLVIWADVARDAVPLPAVHAPVAGMVVIVVGGVLIAAGAIVLIARGGGLPMNAFPPPKLVRTGIYRWLRNPMYIGFGLTCAGAAIRTGSAAGLWLITPVAWLGAAALIYGYERQDLRRRFGPTALDPPLLSLPRGNGAPPTAAQRVAVFLWVFFPWLIAYYAVQALGRPPDAFGLALPFERQWPVWQWTEVFYVGTYLFVPLTAFVVRARRDLHRFAIEGIIATVVVALFWIVLPVVAVNRPFTPTNVFGELLAFEQAHSWGVAAFPAFHVLWALLAGEAWSANARATGRALWRWAGWTLALLIIASCITTGSHTVLDVAAALVLYPPIRHYDEVWEWVRARTERIANSWHEWRIGPVRVINHGVYAAAGAGVGLIVAGMAAGRGGMAAATWTGFCILFGAGLWAQALEGSSKLLRPFGWYGGLVGGVIGAITSHLAGVPLLPLMAALVIAAPWIQLLGRFRCLVQGCCHGGPVSARIGIRYHHPRSRVTHLADLTDVPIHPTPLYSMIGNVIVGVILIRLRTLGAADAVLVGVYLILAGIARFVEESYRAEPQTPNIAGLHVYHWAAIVSVVAGAAITTLPSGPAVPPFTAPSPGLVVGAIVLGLSAGFAMGVDFPGSNRRFARLASVD